MTELGLDSISKSVSVFSTKSVFPYCGAISSGGRSHILTLA